MKHGCVPIEMIGERKFGEARAAIERAPVGQGWHALPAVLRGE